MVLRRTTLLSRASTVVVAVVELPGRNIFTLVVAGNGCWKTTVSSLTTHLTHFPRDSLKKKETKIDQIYLHKRPGSHRGRDLHPPPPKT